MGVLVCGGIVWLVSHYAKGRTIPEGEATTCAEEPEPVEVLREHVALLSQARYYNAYSQQIVHKLEVLLEYVDGHREQDIRLTDLTAYALPLAVQMAEYHNRCAASEPISDEAARGMEVTAEGFAFIISLLDKKLEAIRSHNNIDIETSLDALQKQVALLGG